MSSKRISYENFNSEYKISRDKTYSTNRNVNISGTHLMKTMLGLGLSEKQLKVNVDGTRTLLLFMNVKSNNKLYS